MWVERSIPGTDGVFQIRWTLTAPAPLLDSARFNRLHNRISREAATLTMFDHQKKRLPAHFGRAARSRYGYAPRSRSYRAIKRKLFGSITDIVKRGATEKEFLRGSHQVQIGGSADDVMRVRMFMRFPFPVSRQPRRKDGRMPVTSDVISDEVGAWDQKDRDDAADDYRRHYYELLDRELANSPKMRKAVEAAKAIGSGI